MRAIRKYSTESAYNADVTLHNVVANQVTKTEDTGEVHYIVNDYTFTLQYDAQNCSVYSINSQVFRALTDVQLGMGNLTDLQFNILKNGGRVCYVYDVQANNTHHITKVEYSGNALNRFGWTEGDLNKDICDILNGGATYGDIQLGSFFMGIKDLIEITIDGTDKMFIARNAINNLLLIDIGIDDFVAAVNAVAGL